VKNHANGVEEAITTVPALILQFLKKKYGFAQIAIVWSTRQKMMVVGMYTLPHLK